MKIIRTYLAYISWLIALMGMLGSLFFSEIMKLPPCLLCWYQRIALYPLVVLLPVGIVLNDKRVKWYALPLSVIGLFIAIYHNLLYYGFIPESIAPCTAGVSCTTKQIELLGFITIPLLSLIAFLIITVALILYTVKETHEPS